jgi:hypothetical protein
MAQFLKINEFHIGESGGKQEIIQAVSSQKQCCPQKQLPPLSVIKGPN